MSERERGAEPYYKQDGITIYHGDCREILPQIAPVDLIVTDPPYGVGYDYGDGCDDDPGSVARDTSRFGVWNSRRMKKRPPSGSVECWSSSVTLTPW